MAVLPFVNTSDDPEASLHLSEAVGAFLSAKLNTLPDLRVSPWLTSARYRSGLLPPQDIAEELNVEALVMGTFRLTGDWVQCSIFLLDGMTGEKEWETAIEKPLTELLDVQREMALEVATQIRGTLADQEKETLGRKSTGSFEAYDAYQRGFDALQVDTRESKNQALAYFQEAVKLNPLLAEAYVGIGAIYTSYTFFGWGDSDENLSRAEGNYQKALDLDPTLQKARAGLIQVHWERGAFEEGLRVGHEAIRHGLGDVDELIVRARAYALCGMPSRAVPLFGQVITLDPANAEAHYFLVYASNRAKEYETSIRAGETFLRKFGDDPEVHLWMGSSFHALGESKKALLHLKKALELGVTANMLAFSVIGDVYFGLGMKQEAMNLWEDGAEELEGKIQKNPNQPRVRWFLASLYGRLGKRAAFERELSIATNAAVALRAASGFGPGVGLVGGLIKLGEHERAIELLIRADEEGFYLGEELPDHYDALKDLPGYLELTQKIAEKHKRFLALY